MVANKGKLLIVLVVAVVAIAGIAAWSSFHPKGEMHPQAVQDVATTSAASVSSSAPDVPHAAASLKTASSSVRLSASTTAAVIPAPALATSSPAAGQATATSSPTPSSNAPSAITVSEAPNVGLLCHYKISDPALKSAYSFGEDANGELLAKGSGVIVSPDGYILTAKHMVDLQWTNIAYSSSTGDAEAQLNDALTLDYCDVGVPPAETVPSADLIQTINPSITLSNPFPYVATLAFDPPKGDMSDSEFYSLDFAVLKITGPFRGCQTFNLCTLPASYPYSRVLSASTPDEFAVSQTLLDFGYPAESINSYGGSFTDFYLKGAVGRLIGYGYGDRYFKDTPLSFAWQANDVLPGRSGSPVYWQGYVVGIEVSGESDNSTMDHAIAMPAIAKVLEASGLGYILKS